MTKNSFFTRISKLFSGNQAEINAHLEKAAQRFEHAGTHLEDASQNINAARENAAQMSALAGKIGDAGKILGAATNGKVESLDKKDWKKAIEERQAARKERVDKLKGNQI